MTTKNAIAAEGADEQFVAELYRALKDAGSIIPVTEADVAEIDGLPQRRFHEVPSVLLDAKAVFAKIGEPQSCVLKPTPHVNLEVQQNLARAAREGGHIPPEVEDKMRRDRKQAERDGRK